jgi:hypothetical protein
MELSNLTHDRAKTRALANTEMTLTFEVSTALKMWAVYPCSLARGYQCPFQHVGYHLQGYTATRLRESHIPR